MAANKTVDPLQINQRLYRQLAALLSQLEDPKEEVTIRERMMALTAIARVQIAFVGLRKENKNDDSAAGSAVRKYAGAFKAKNAGGGRKAVSRLAAVPAEEPDEPEWLNALDADDDDPAA